MGKSQVVLDKAVLETQADRLPSILINTLRAQWSR